MREIEENEIGKKTEKEKDIFIYPLKYLSISYKIFL